MGLLGITTTKIKCMMQSTKYIWKVHKTNKVIFENEKQNPYWAKKKALGKY
jgi:hypothetical protein